MREDAQQTVDQAELKGAIQRAHERLAQLEQKYPTLKAYLVFAHRGGQTDFKSSMATILKEFPAMVVDDRNKERASTLIAWIEAQEMKRKPGKEVDTYKEELTSVLERLRIRTDINIEIRFNDLKYELVWKLQNDDLVNRELTPQSRASIRIILGTIGDFSCSIPS